MTTVVDATLLFDDRVKCYSLMTAVSTNDYLKLVGEAYAQRGGLQHQRDALKTTTARRIRSRMVSDIRNGAILPPVVIGVVVDEATLNNIPNMPPSQVVDMISGALVGTISIIDGMQRTTAFLAALDGDKEVADLTIRIECWIAKSTDSLIYRMLVLNTGQVPWNLSRQLQVVFAPLIVEMTSRVKFERVLNLDKAERRMKAGEYSTDSLVELYIAFGLRKTDVDTQETLADEFSRLDVTDTIAEDRYNKFFYPVLQTMVDLDQAFSRLDAEIAGPQGDDPAPNSLKVLKLGRSIFDSRPARIGYIVAASIAIIGRVGMDKDAATSEKLLAEFQEQVKNLAEELSVLDVNRLAEFLKLDVLSERLYGQKRSAVGRYERVFFDSAFKVLIEEAFEVPSMEPAWRV